MDAMLIHKTASLCGWIAAPAIVFLTLGPQRWRPKTGLPDVERFAAFFVTGTCLGVAHPRRRSRLSCMILLSAGSLEVCQNLIQGRHGRWRDGIAKAAGGLVGLSFAEAINRLLEARE